MSRLRRLVTDIPPRSPGLDPKPISVRCVVDNALLGQFFLRVLRFSPVSIFPSCFIHIFTYVLPLRIGQTGATWEPAKKQCCSGNWGGLGRKVLALVLVFRTLRRMRWERRVVCMGEIINTRKVLIGISEEKKLHEDGGVDGTVILKRTLTLRRLMSYIYGAPILDVSRSHTTTQHSR